MKTLTICASLVLAFLGMQVHADDAVRAVRVKSNLTFTMNSNEEPGETVYFSCSALEDNTKAMLKKLGATDVRVFCSGSAGNPDRPVLYPNVQASFTATRLPAPGMTGEDTTATWQNISIHDFNSCAEVNQLLKHLMPALELRGLTLSHCFNSNASYRYNFQSLVAK